MMREKRSETLQGQILAFRRAAAALLELLLKLEKDGHIVSVGTSRLPVVLLPEMLASLLGRESDLPEDSLQILMALLPPEDARIGGLLGNAIRQRAAELRQDGELPGAYLALCRFDAMAQEYDAAFYRRMQVEDPGPLGAYYLQLLDAAHEILLRHTGRTDHGWAAFRARFTDAAADTCL